VSASSWEAIDDANLAIAFGRLPDALASIDRSDRLPNERDDNIAILRFLILDRMQQVDSAIAAGERYLANTNNLRFQNDAYFLGGVQQRLGEMYEAKGNVDKALTHYQAFVDLWKDADPELQPRVRDVRARVERIQRRRG
jgi:tetratricopeptide (TPR) repeat protein